MATPATPEAIEIRRRGRRRLIGAIAIVILLVVFVPMILDSEQRPSHADPSLEIPKKDSAPPLPTPTSAAGTARPTADVVPAQAGTRSSTNDTPPATAEAPPANAETPPAKAGTLETKQVTPKTAAAPKAPPAAVTQASSPKLEGFAVQVGAFRDETKLKQAREKLAALHISHYVEHHGDLNRLRAGPFATREAAEKALASIKAASLQGQVVPLP